MPHLLALSPIRREPPQGQQGALTLAELIGRVLPELEVLEDLVLGILVHQTFEDLQRVLHLLGVDGVLLLVSRRSLGRGGLLVRVVATGLLALVGLLNHLLLHLLVGPVRHVVVVDFPLGEGVGELGHGGGLGGDAAFAKRVVKGLWVVRGWVGVLVFGLVKREQSEKRVLTHLGSTVTVVELVLSTPLISSIILDTIRILAVVLHILLHGHPLVSSILSLLGKVLLLSLVLARLLVKRATVYAKLDSHVLGLAGRIRLVAPVLEIVLGNILGDVGIITCKHTGDFLLELSIS